jgi:hypothetical protein
VFNDVAQRVLTVADVRDGEDLYLVPPDRLFVWPTKEVGRRASALGAHSAVPAREQRPPSMDGMPALWRLQHPAPALLACVPPQVTVAHVLNNQGNAVEVETLSLSPRVYMLYNFIDPDEADQVGRARAISADSASITINLWERGKEAEREGGV